MAINFSVVEGEVARIRQIKLLGAKEFSESELLALFQLSTPGWLSWYTKNDQYSKQKLSADLETLRSFYQNRGYLDFDTTSTQVSITPDKQDIYITITLNEGQKYTISGLKMTGDLVLPEEEYRKLVTLKKGDTFSREKLTETTKAISDRLGNEGYAFANVNAAPEVDKEKREVAFTIFVDPGRRVYVRRINVAGNTKTRDEVIRREVRQMEGAWYDGSKINRSKVRVERLGYFDDVTVETPAAPEATDQVDVNLAVKERSTGNLMLGAGFSSSEKIVLSASLSQQNLFGSGNAVALQVNTGKINRTLALSFTNPYFTQDGISFGWDVYHRKVDPTSLSVAPYRTSSMGMGLRFGLPIAEDDSVSFGLAADRTEISTYYNDSSYGTSPTQYRRLCNELNGSAVDSAADCSASSLMATAGWARDGRDSYLLPRKGVFQKFFVEATAPVGDLRYTKISYQHQHWFPVGRDYSLMLNGEFGWAHGYGGKSVPFYKNFYVGGIGSVRGFEQSSLGPKVVNDGEDDSLGGTRKLVGNAEFFFPLPGAGLDKSFRMSAFLDAGYVWGKDGDTNKEQPMRFSDLRYSTGLSFTWSSPLGPLNFALGIPLKKKDEDKTQKFQFQLGTGF